MVVMDGLEKVMDDGFLTDIDFDLEDPDLTDWG